MPELDPGGVADLTGGKVEQLARNLEVGPIEARLRRTQGRQTDAVQHGLRRGARIVQVQRAVSQGVGQVPAMSEAARHRLALVAA